MLKKRHFAMERLEARELKAGDVTAVLQGGSLYLTEAAGQAGKDNSVIISQQPSGMVRVAGNATADHTVSKVNGAAYQDFRVTGSLSVNFGTGNDLVVLGGEGTPSMSPTFTSVNIDVSAPQVSNLPLAAVATVKAAVVTPPTTPIVSDNDSVVVWGVNVKGSMSITTGVGNDYVYMSGASIGTAGAGNLTINTGSGNDNVDLEQMGFVTGSISLQMNSAASESDHVAFNGVYAKGNIQVLTGAGADFVNAQDTTSFATLDIETGAGNDSVSLLNAHATDKLMALLGDGNDSLSVDYLYANSMDFDGGSGSNSLTVTKNLSGGTTTAYSLNEVGWTYINGHLVLGLINPGTAAI